MCAKQSPHPLYYLAYGSNLHPVRLRDRIPSAAFIGPVEITGYRLVFQKRGQDGSGKCHLVRLENLSDKAYGAIYSMAEADKPLLDQHEGKGHGYFEGRLTVDYQGDAFQCFTYFADPAYMAADLQPYHWYKNLVFLGARHLQFPDAYVQSIEMVESVEDPDEVRRKRHDRLIEEIIHYQRV